MLVDTIREVLKAMHAENLHDSVRASTRAAVENDRLIFGDTL